MKYIKSPINYIGNKYKLLSQIIPLFPKNIHTFVDVFGGSGTVLLNVNADIYIYNDINKYISEVFKGLLMQSYDITVKHIEEIISEYNLSKTNKEGFESLREDYNNKKYMYSEWETLYTLMCYSFNYQFRFNNKNLYNSSFGKDRSHFSENQKKSISVCNSLKKDVIFTSDSFMNIDYSVFTESDFLYFDPPYLLGIATYNERNGWDENKEHRLLNILDYLNERKVKFALSNVMEHKGMINEILKKWSNKYNTHILNADYTNCSYHLKNKTISQEVLITNY